METVKGVRCDGCRAMQKKDGDFLPFAMPPSPDGRFPGIARAKDPKKMVILHACPQCQPKIRKAVSLRMPGLLPMGPLRKVLDRIKRKGALVTPKWGSA